MGNLVNLFCSAMLVGVAAGSLSEVWGEVQRAAGAMGTDRVAEYTTEHPNT